VVLTISVCKSKLVNKRLLLITLLICIHYNIYHHHLSDINRPYLVLCVFFFSSFLTRADFVTGLGTVKSACMG
jgi:hypothetical protein